MNDKLQKIVSLCKRRGFVFQNSEIYGGIQGFYDYGPLGALMKSNIKQLWMSEMLQNHENILPIDGDIINHPLVWEASGHVKSFSDPLVDCKKCKKRFRADNLIEDWLEQQPKNLAIGDDSFVDNSLLVEKGGKKISVGDLPIDEMNEFIKAKIKCPECGGELTEIRKFNLLVETSLGVVEGEKRTAYLRGEACQNIYLNYKNVLDSMRIKIPFGIVQIGKAFRNEITPGQFLFRLREFEQWDLQFFTNPKEMEKWYNYWKEARMKWYKGLVNNPDKLRFKQHGKEELAHYAKVAFDIEYKTDIGWKEWEGIHWRGDWDLSRHGEYSKNNFTYLDQITGEKFVPQIVESSGGVDRTFLFLLFDAYCEENIPLLNKEGKGAVDTRIVLKLRPDIAPYKVAIFPLMRNKEDIVDKAKGIFDSLKNKFMCAWDDNGNVGKRYRRQDEIGTPWCVTVDYQTLEDNTVTVRDRDTMEQIRLPIGDLDGWVSEKLS